MAKSQTEMKPEVGIELLVVILVVGRVVAALLLAGSGFLWFEAFSVVSLTIAALITELRSYRDRLDHLKSRSSLSNGIVLGAITVPTLLSARLLQMQRYCSETGDMNLAVIETKYGFSLAVACSISMLFCVSSFARKQTRPSHWLGVSVVEFCCAVVLFVAAVRRKSVWSGVDGVSWSAVYILGGKMLFSYVVETFSYTGTVGEVMLAVQGIVLYGANALTAFSASSVNSDDKKPEEQGLINALLQALLLGLLAVPLLTKLIGNGLHQASRPFSKGGDSTGTEARKDGFIRSRAGVFYLLLVLVVFAAVPLWVEFVTGVRVNPVVWCLQYVVVRPVPRLLLSLYWIGIIYTPLPYLYRISAQNMAPTILIRKCYHLMVVFMFVPALVLDPTFLQLAFGVAFAAFLVVEMVRVGKLPPYGERIDKFMTAFTDHRDSGSLIISHFSLLLGCALPVWLNSGPGDRPLAGYAGVLSLGVLDTFASLIGLKYGKVRVSPNSKKTVEGTLAGVGALLVSVIFVILMLPTAARPTGLKSYLALVAAATGAGVLEAYTLQLDNAFIPLLFYALLCL